MRPLETIFPEFGYTKPGGLEQHSYTPQSQFFLSIGAEDIPSNLWVVDS